MKVSTILDHIDSGRIEVLKLLQKSYAGKVKLIYIDPPYNTGQGLVYPDKPGRTVARRPAKRGRRNLGR